MIYEYKGIMFECDQDIDETEAQNYIERGLEKYSKELKSIEAHIDGNDVELKYHLDGVHFKRLRRITGYLSDVASFNDGKTAELNDTVKHTVEM